MFLICGEALYDLFIEAEAAHGNLQLDARVGGSPFNVAIGMARLGSECALLTGLSIDLLGERLYAELKNEHVNSDYLVRTGRRTTLSLVGVDVDGSPAYAFYGVGSADCNLSVDDLPTIGPEIKGLHFGSYSIAVPPVADAFKHLAAIHADKCISLDPNVRPTIEPNMAVWRASVDYFANLTDVLKISQEDFNAMYAGQSNELKVQQWMDTGVKLVIITDGERQVKAWSDKGFTVAVSPPKTEVIDAVGAGDTFTAAVLSRLSEFTQPLTALDAIDQNKLKEILHHAACAASITCSRRGANMPTKNELNALLNSC